MNRILTISAVLACLLPAGCASVGNERIAAESQETIASKLVEGRTTKAEVQQALGSATRVSFTDGGNEIWTYAHVRSTPKATNFIPLVNLFSSGSDVTTKELIVMFDRDGVVSKYTMRETQNAVRRGIGQ